MEWGLGAIVNYDTFCEGNEKKSNKTPINGDLSEGPFP